MQFFTSASIPPFCFLTATWKNLAVFRRQHSSRMLVPVRPRPSSHGQANRILAKAAGGGFALQCSFLSERFRKIRNKGTGITQPLVGRYALMRSWGTETAAAAVVNNSPSPLDLMSGEEPNRGISTTPEPERLTEPTNDLHCSRGSKIASEIITSLYVLSPGTQVHVHPCLNKEGWEL